MAELEGVISKAFSRYLTGFALSKAILEDYAKVVAKLENVSEQEVVDRVRKRTEEIFQETKKQQLTETEEARQGQSKAD